MYKMLEGKNKELLEQLKNQLKEANDSFIGYPVSKDFNYSELNPFLQYPINNLGDPFEPSTYRVQTHEMEREVIAFYSKLFRANHRDFWGYITNGGSEGNLYGLYLGRELYPKAMVYYSESTHYSVKKNIQLLNIPSIIIKSQENGEIDYEDLKNTIQMNRHLPAIVLVNFGTTMTEAKDDVFKIKKILKGLAVQNHYIHCDGALAGSFGVFIEPRIPFDFEDGIDSISISGHKFIGSPIPCGVLLAKKSNRDRIAKGIAYIGSSDTTITGSRNGHSPLFLWYGIKKIGIEGLKERYLYSLEVAKYCEEQLNNIGIKAWRNPSAITVVIPKVPNIIKNKWQLATENNISHIVCMPNVTKKQIDTFVNELKEHISSSNDTEKEVKEYNYNLV